VYSANISFAGDAGVSAESVELVNPPVFHSFTPA